MGLKEDGLWIRGSEGLRQGGKEEAAESFTCLEACAVMEDADGRDRKGRYRLFYLCNQDPRSVEITRSIQPTWGLSM
jgi:hypothetical protein